MSGERKLIVLAVALLIAAGFGARSLLALSSRPSESGFDGDDPFSLVTVPSSMTAIEFAPPRSPRNPFVTDGLDPTVDSSGDDAVDGSEEGGAEAAVESGGDAPGPRETAGDPTNESGTADSDETGTVATEPAGDLVREGGSDPDDARGR